MTQQWQVAPCRKSSGTRRAHTGSERAAHEPAQGGVENLPQPRRVAQRHQTTERAVGVGGGRRDEQARRRGPVLCLRPGVEAFAEAGGPVAGVHDPIGRVRHHGASSSVARSTRSMSKVSTHGTPRAAQASGIFTRLREPFPVFSWVTTVQECALA